MLHNLNSCRLWNPILNLVLSPQLGEFSIQRKFSGFRIENFAVIYQKFPFFALTTF